VNSGSVRIRFNEIGQQPIGVFVCDVQFIVLVVIRRKMLLVSFSFSSLLSSSLLSALDVFSARRPPHRSTSINNRFVDDNDKRLLTSVSSPVEQIDNIVLFVVGHIELVVPAAHLRNGPVGAHQQWRTLEYLIRHL
jgi:hypothetical protein